MLLPSISIYGQFLDKLGNEKYHSKSQYRINSLLYYSELMPSIKFFFHIRTWIRTVYEHNNREKETSFYIYIFLGMLTKFDKMVKKMAVPNVLRLVFYFVSTSLIQTALEFMSLPPDVSVLKYPS